QGFMGEGMVIAVFDSGFKDADKQSYFHHLFQNKKILDTYDFVRGEKSVFEDDEHGRMTLSCIAAYEINKLVGTAPKADFYLFRTEDASSEFPIEEYNWLKAAEVADSLGVDIVSSSLGYTDFDDNNSSYQTYQMDGKTAVSSRAAQILAQKGVVVVSSAGNEGGSSWNIISAPADAADILSIGSVNSREAISYFSSRGYTADGRVKPDVLAMGSSTAVGDNYNKVTFANGTSFSCPTAAGVIAGFWQANPQLSSKQVLNYIRRSGKQYDTPDAQYGYGVLSFSKAHYLAQKETTSYGIMTNKDSTQILCYPNPYPKNNKDTLPTIAWGASYQGKTIEISIFDSSAKLVFEEKLANIEKESIINIFATLPKGEYLISIKPNYSQQKSWRWIID
ncbi:MAG: S8 family serine peptidase, partial [Thermonemataceae bacterium]|nr:S8 family serine peptidase [Thermonemataceae bacterium]